MKLYFATTKRIAKKKLKHCWEKLNLGKDLKVGDIFTSCNGYNDIIQEITPIYRTYGLSTGVLVSDFDIMDTTMAIFGNVFVPAIGSTVTVVLFNADNEPIEQKVVSQELLPTIAEQVELHYQFE